MKLTQLESGGSLIEIAIGEGAVVWSEGERSMILPKQETLPEDFALLITLVMRLDTDHEFAAEMMEWFEEKVKEAKA